jgi:molybdopterin-guanine dinucleotide biosynthesis protein A
MTERGDGRLANVAGAVIPGAGSPDGARAAARIVRCLASLFEEVICVGSDPPPGTGGRRAGDIDGPPGVLRDIGSALAAATAERVLVVAADTEEIRPDLLLAFVAWPEAEAVVPRAWGEVGPPCALYEREEALRALRAQLASGCDDVRSWLETLDGDSVEPDALPSTAAPDA